MHWKNWLKLTGFALLAWMLSTIDWALLSQNLLKINPVYLAGYLGCFVTMMMVRSMRLRIALSKIDHQITYKDCYIAIVEPAFMGQVTLGRFGEFTRVGYLHALGIPMQESISVVMVERLIDTGVLLVFGAGGIAYIFAPKPYHLAGGIIVAIGLLFLFSAIRGDVLLFRCMQKYLGCMRRWEPSFVTRHRQALTISFHRVMNRAAMSIFLLGLVCMALNFTQIFFLAKAFGFNVDHLVVIFSYTAAVLVSLLPISVGGLGTRESIYIMIMAREGIMKEQALLFSLIDGVVLSVFGILLLLIPIWLLKMGKR